MNFTGWHNRVRWLALLSVLLLVALVLVLVQAREPQAGGPGPDPYAEPIYDASEAITRTLAALPDGIPYSGEVARLLDRQTIAKDWYHESEEWQPGHEWMPDSPIWVVGVLGDGLTLGDTLSMGVMRFDDPEPMEGAFALWDANSGVLVSSGGLAAGTRFQYGDLIQLIDEPMVVDHATSVPTPSDGSSGVPVCDASDPTSSGATLDATDAHLSSDSSAPKWWSGATVHNDRRPEIPAESVEDWVRFTSTIGDVHVVGGGPILFNTDSGEEPTPETAGRADFGVALGCVVALEIDASYKGIEPGVAGFVVWQWGGSRDGFTELTLPPLVFLSDSVGTAFVEPFSEDDTVNAVGHMKHVVAAAAARSRPGAVYLPAYLGNFYEHYDGVALIALEGHGSYDAYAPAEMSTADFYQDLYAALGTPAP